MNEWYKDIDPKRIVTVQRGTYGSHGMGFHFHSSDSIIYIPLMDQEKAVRHMLKLIDEGKILIPQGFKLSEVYDNVLACKQNLASEISRLASKI